MQNICWLNAPKIGNLQAILQNCMLQQPELLWYRNLRILGTQPWYIYMCENKAIWFSTALSHIILFMAERIYAHSTYIYVSTTCMTRISSPNILVYFWFEKNDTCISKQQHTNCLDVQDFFSSSPLPSPLKRKTVCTKYLFLTLKNISFFTTDKNILPVWYLNSFLW